MINRPTIDEVWAYWIFWLDLIVANNIHHYYCLALLTKGSFPAHLPSALSSHQHISTINTDWARRGSSVLIIIYVD